MRYMSIKGGKNHAERGEKPRLKGGETTLKGEKNHVYIPCTIVEN